MGLADEGIRLTLRLPEQLRDRLLRQSRQSMRSMNSEIIAILEKSINLDENELQMDYPKQSEQSNQQHLEIREPDEVADLIDYFERLSEERKQLVLQLVKSL